MSRLLPWMAAATVLLWGAWAWPFTVDDAFILARYAHRLVAGQGYTMNDGPATDGVTGPLGLVPALLGAWLFDAPVAASKVGGLAAASGAAWWVTRSAPSGRARAMVLVALVSTGLLGIWAVGGLDTGLATLAFTGLGLSLLEESPSAGQGVRLGAAVAALAWLRPEAAPAALVALLLCPRPGRAAAWGLASTGLVGIVLFRVALFGTPLPLSAAAKPPDLAAGAAYVARGVGLVWGVGAVGLALALGRERWRRGAALVVVHVLSVAVAGGDWMPGFRLLLPAVPLSALVVSGALAPRRYGAWIVGAAAVVPLVVSTLAALELPGSRHARASTGARLASALAREPGPVAMVDVGFLAFESGVEVVDLGGVTDPAVGRLPGGHVDKHVDVGLLADRSPSAVLLHSSTPPQIEGGRLRAFSGHPVEHRVAALPWVRRHFRVSDVFRYAPGYHYVLLRRVAPGVGASSVAE